MIKLCVYDAMCVVTIFLDYIAFSRAIVRVFVRIASYTRCDLVVHCVSIFGY